MLNAYGNLHLLLFTKIVKRKICVHFQSISIIMRNAEVVALVLFT